MNWLKRRVQKWLGIESLANRVVELDMEIHPLAFPHELPSFPEIRKGYDKPE